jgi:hypothetical protein
MMIMLDSWARAYRTHKLSDIGVAAWNTYAQIHNTYHAISDFGEAFGSVVDALKGKGSDSDSSDSNGGGVGVVLVFVVVILALLSGVITTALIIRRVAGSYQLPERRQEEKKELVER